MKGRVGIYRAQNNRCYAAAKGPTQRLSVFTQRRRDPRCCGLESGKR